MDCEGPIRTLIMDVGIEGLCIPEHSRRVYSSTGILFLWCRLNADVFVFVFASPTEGDPVMYKSAEKPGVRSVTSVVHGTSATVILLSSPVILSHT